MMCFAFAQAQAVAVPTHTMTFDSYVYSGVPNMSGTITEDGISLNLNGQAYALPGSYYGVFGTGNVALATSYPRTITVSMVGGGLFNFDSILFNETNSAIPSQLMSFTGHQFGGATLTDSRNSDGNYSVAQTYSGFSTMTNLTSLDITVGAGVFDNIAVTAVPEAETYAMMLAGLGLVGFMARRRNSGQA